MYDRHTPSGVEKDIPSELCIYWEDTPDKDLSLMCRVGNYALTFFLRVKSTKIYDFSKLENLIDGEIVRGYLVTENIDQVMVNDPDNYLEIRLNPDVVARGATPP